MYEKYDYKIIDIVWIIFFKFLNLSYSKKQERNVINIKLTVFIIAQGT